MERPSSDGFLEGGWYRLMVGLLLSILLVTLGFRLDAVDEVETTEPECTEPE